MVENIKIIVNGLEMEVASGTSLLEISKIIKKKEREPIVASVNDIINELSYIPKENENIEFLDVTSSKANRIYVNGLILLINYVFNEIFHGKNKIIVKHSVDKAVCLETEQKITKEKLLEIEKKMHVVVEANLPINKITVLKSEAIDYFKKTNDPSKVHLLEYMTSTYVHLYKIGNMYNYIFSKMPCETSCLKEFKLTYLSENEFVLQFPAVGTGKIDEYVHHEKIFDVFKEAKDWGKLIHVENSSDLNNVVSMGYMDHLIRISETLMNNRILNQVKEIQKTNSKIKVVLIAGPSSSGKTTACTKLAVYLHSFGLTPKMISMDNFFKNRVDTPKKTNGEYDFESLEAIDLKLFNKTIKDLLDGKTVKMPTFDFYSGEKKFKDEMTLAPTDILLIEGLHALNPKLLTEVDRKYKYKIYLSPLTSVNIDRDNRIYLTDNRLLRRIIRDNRTRGYSVSDTLKLWKEVREGEEKYVFPYQDEADYVFDTALIYEFCLLKTYVMPLLYSVKSDDPNYSESVRLMKVLNVFLPIPSEAIPADSIIREFIGGSCF